MKKILMSVFLFVAVGAVCAQEIVVEVKKPVSNLHFYRVTWNSLIGNHYQVWTTTNAVDWNQYGSVVVATSNMTTVSINDIANTPQTRFVQVEQIPDVGGSLLIDNNTHFSGEVVIPFDTVSLGSGVQYVELQDVSGGATNCLGFIDMANAPTNTFVVDSTKLQSGIAHNLRIMVVDDFGPATSEGIRRGYSSMKTLLPTNSISLPYFKEKIEWKFFLEFATVFTEGVWSVTATNNNGSSSFAWSGSLQSDTGTNGVISVSDQNAVYTGYTGDYFDIVVSISPVGAPTEQLLRRAQIVRRPPFAEFISVEQPDLFEDGNHFGLQTIMGQAMFQMNRYGDMFRLETTNRVVTPTEWNVMNAVSSWQRLGYYLQNDYGRMPSYLHFFGNGGPVSIGDQGTVQSLSLDQFSRVADSLSFVHLDGFNNPIGIVKALTGGRKLSRADLLREGLYPRFVLFWKTNPFGEGRNSDDVTADLISFSTRFYEAAFERNQFSGLAFRTFREALEIASVTEEGLPNPVAVHLDWTGCDELYADEIVLSDDL